MRVSASYSLQVYVDLGVEHTFSVITVGSFFSIFPVVPSRLPIIPTIITVSLTVTIGRASRASSVIVVSFSSSVIALCTVILAWRVLAAA